MGKTHRINMSGRINMGGEAGGHIGNVSIKHIFKPAKLRKLEKHHNMEVVPKGLHTHAVGKKHMEVGVKESYA